MLSDLWLSGRLTRHLVSTRRDGGSLGRPVRKLRGGHPQDSIVVYDDVEALASAYRDGLALAKFPGRAGRTHDAAHGIGGSLFGEEHGVDVVAADSGDIVHGPGDFAGRAIHEAGLFESADTGVGLGTLGKYGHAVDHDVLGHFERDDHAILRGVRRDVGGELYFDRREARNFYLDEVWMLGFGRWSRSGRRLHHGENHFVRKAGGLEFLEGARRGVKLAGRGLDFGDDDVRAQMYYVHLHDVCVGERVDGSGPWRGGVGHAEIVAGAGGRVGNSGVGNPTDAALGRAHLNIFEPAREHFHLLAAAQVSQLFQLIVGFIHQHVRTVGSAVGIAWRTRSKRTAGKQSDNQNENWQHAKANFHGKPQNSGAPSVRGNL